MVPRQFPSAAARNTLAAVLLIFTCGCLKQSIQRITLPGAEAYNDFIIVRPKENDTLTILARQYLKDPDKAWAIAEFNDVSAVTPEEELVIPRRTFRRGGLSHNGCQAVPVLVYSGFTKSRNSARLVSKSRFAAQMKELRRRGYHVISLSQFTDFLQLKDDLPPRSVLITIDDEGKAVKEIAFPILKRYGYPAVIFAYTDNISENRMLSWRDLKSMKKSGIIVQPHAVTPRNLTTPESGESAKTYFRNIQREIVISTKEIGQKLNQKSRYFAYPKGEFNNLVTALIRSYGFSGAFTRKPGANPFYQDRFRLRRNEISGHDSISSFRAKLKVFLKKKI